MSGYAIVVDFRLRPGAMGAFRRLIDENARASAQGEPGCRRFDVLVAKGEADRLLLYEIYDDRAAFEAHLRTAHFASFNRASEPLVADKTVVEYALVCEGSEAG
jgi:(4S)-4-hydroxy-5-phosphonooxypentane-2,3-dione isomerase